MPEGGGEAWREPRLRDGGSVLDRAQADSACGRGGSPDLVLKDDSQQNGADRAADTLNAAEHGRRAREDRARDRLVGASYRGHDRETDAQSLNELGTAEQPV